jgi:hypothetical protein
MGQTELRNDGVLGSLCETDDAPLGSAFRSLAGQGSVCGAL